MAPSLINGAANGAVAEQHSDQSGPAVADGPSLAGKVPATATPASIPIAIVGMACRFPGNVTSPSQLWELCAEGRDGWQPIPESRFDVKSLYHKNYARAGRVGLPMISRFGGLLTQLDVWI